MKPYTRVFLTLFVTGLFLGLTKVLLAETLSDDKDDTVTIIHTVNPYTAEKGDLYLYNGRFWNKLNDTQKASFIAGVSQGVDTYLLFISSKVDTEQEFNQCFLTRRLFLATGFYPSEIAKVVDGIYKDTSNIKIPITNGIMVATLKAKGVPSHEIEEMLSIYHRFSHQQFPMVINSRYFWWKSNKYYKFR